MTVWGTINWHKSCKLKMESDVYSLSRGLGIPCQGYKGMIVAWSLKLMPNCHDPRYTLVVKWNIGPGEDTYKTLSIHRHQEILNFNSVTPGSLTLDETGVVNLSEVADKPLISFHHNHTIKFAENVKLFTLIELYLDFI